MQTVLILSYNFVPGEGGGRVTTINAGMGCAIFWGAFFQAENKFWGIIFGKITQVVINFGVSFLKNDSLG